MDNVFERVREKGIQFIELVEKMPKSIKIKKNY